MNWWLQVFFLTFYSISLKALALRGAPFQPTLFFRGLVVVALVSLLCLRRGWRLWPKNPSFQFLRLLNSGFALYLSTLAYNYHSATSIALLARLDLFWILTFEKKKGQPKWLRPLSFLLSLLLFSGVLFLGLPGDTYLGMFLATSATALLTWGYFLAKKSGVEENLGVAIGTPGLSLMLFAVISYGVPSANHLPESDWVVLTLVSGVCLFLFYLFLMNSFRYYSVYIINVGALVATLAIAAIEPWLFDIPRSGGLFLALFALLALAAIPIKFQSRAIQR